MKNSEISTIITWSLDLGPDGSAPGSTMIFRLATDVQLAMDVQADTSAGTVAKRLALSGTADIREPIPVGRLLSALWREFNKDVDASNLPPELTNIGITLDSVEADAIYLYEVDEQKQDTPVTKAAICFVCGCTFHSDDKAGSIAIFFYKDNYSGAGSGSTSGDTGGTTPNIALGVAIKAPISLGGVPLFGGMLSGVAINELGVIYSTGALPSGTLTQLADTSASLPSSVTQVVQFLSGLTSQKGGIPQGLGLVLSLSAGGSSQTFAVSLKDTGSGGTSAPPPRPAAPRALLARAADAPPAQPDTSSDGTAPGDPSWVSVQKSFGPLFVQRVGVAWGGGTISLLLDASVSLSVLSVALTGFSIGVSLDIFSAASPTQIWNDLHFSLNGLSVAYESGPVTLSGALLKATDATTGASIYAGDALIKIPELTLGAIGSYENLNGQPSLFIFAYLGAPLGGPPFFFVTGLAAGFGYNQQLLLPAFDQVNSFPLVSFVMGTATPQGATLAQQQANALTQVLASTRATAGEYWLAAGVRFTSFELIDSFALLIVEFGHDLQIDVMGLSRIAFPPQNVQPAPRPLAMVEMGLQAALIPSQGVFFATASLTPSSFVLDPKCRLTGGFAFYTWFKDDPSGTGPYAGDFVVTLGGYHPSYVLPKSCATCAPWYPTVPRLGFNWPISAQVTAKGECYFALTPSAVMAGALLSIMYQSGNLRAWFNAQADFIISWRPFYYQATINISLGASYTSHVVVTHTFTLELGVSLQVEGPPFQGTATVHWWVISFTVHIGKHQSDTLPGNDPLDTWSKFSNTFLLPAPTSSAAALPGASSSDSAASILQFQLQQGLVRVADDKSWYVAPSGVVFSIASKIPISTATFTGGQFSYDDPANPGAQPPTPPQFGVRAMNIAAATSTLSVVMTANTSSQQWGFTYLTNGVPSALWGTTWLDTSHPPSGTSQHPEMMAGLQVGVQISRTQAQTPIPQVELSAAQLESAQISADAWTGLSDAMQNGAVATPVTDDDQLSIVTSTIMRNDVIQTRSAILSALKDCDFFDPGSVNLSALQASATQLFVSPPTIGPLGTPPAIVV